MRGEGLQSFHVQGQNFPEPQDAPSPVHPPYFNPRKAFPYADSDGITGLYGFVQAARNVHFLLFVPPDNNDIVACGVGTPVGVLVKNDNGIVNRLTGSHIACDGQQEKGEKKQRCCETNQQKRVFFYSAEPEHDKAGNQQNKEQNYRCENPRIFFHICGGYKAQGEKQADEAGRHGKRNMVFVAVFGLFQRQPGVEKKEHEIRKQ